MLKLISNRIIFLDILRAFAVIAMIQGHTIDILLMQSYRDINSVFYYLWNFNRGLTAPIFLFTAGCVFTFVFHNKKLPFLTNPRVKKGLLRGLVLILIGYLIKFPTPNFINFENVSAKSWQIFYAIDVLQLIGIGLILLIFLFYIIEKLNLDFYKVVLTTLLLLLVLSTLFELVNWYSFLPPLTAGYLYMGEGSKFPLLPNLVYMLAGSVLGFYIVNNRFNLNPSGFRIRMITIGISLILIYELLNLLHHQTGNPFNVLSKTANIVYIRTGLVLLIVYLIMELSMRINRLPKIVEVIGRYSLLIYVVHLFILYGSAWNRGIAYYYSYSLNSIESVLSAVALVMFMILIAFVVNYFLSRTRHFRTG